MIQRDKPVVWLIDENVHELATYRAVLEANLPEEIAVSALPARPHKEDYFDVIGNPQTACIVIDQRLKDSGIADYKGIELARYLRSIDAKVPIYILTNFAAEPDEFLGGDWSVEDIIPKADMSKDDRRSTVFARLLRRMNVYQDILHEREHRFRSLLRKSLSTDLDEGERRELEELQLQRMSVRVAEELTSIRALEDILDAHRHLLASLRSGIEDQEDD